MVLIMAMSITIVAVFTKFTHPDKFENPGPLLYTDVMSCLKAGLVFH